MESKRKMVRNYHFDYRYYRCCVVIEDMKQNKKKQSYNNSKLKSKSCTKATKKIDEDTKNKLSEQLKDAAKKGWKLTKGIEKFKKC